MKKLLFVLAVVILSLAAKAQEYIHGSIQKNADPTKVDIFFMPTYNSSAGESINSILLAVAIPSAVSGGITATAAGTGIFASMSVGTLAASPAYTYNNERIFGFSFTATSSPSSPLPWSSGVGFPGVTITFSSSSATGVVKLIDFSNDNGGPNNATYFAVTTSDVAHGFFGDVTDYASLFYAIPGFSQLGTYPNFDQFVKSPPTSLPVSLLQFSGYRAGEKNILKWSTVTEINSRGFDVQRSADGVSFQSLDFVNTKAPGGNSSEKLDYTITDFAPPGIKQYYRLRQIDIDDHARLSNIVLIKGVTPLITAIAELFPNPASTFVNVLLTSPGPAKLNLQVSDMAGRIVLQKNMMVETGSNTVPLDISRLSAGSYMVKLVCGDGCESGAVRFVKQQ